MSPIKVPPEPARSVSLSVVAPAFLIRYIEGIRKCRRYGMTVGPFESVRTDARQNWLFGQGRSWSGDIVTNASQVKTTWHGYGLAIDTAFFDTKGEPTWDVSSLLWAKFGGIMEGVGLAWGGRWQREDFPHVQAKILPKSPTLDDEKLWSGTAVGLYPLWIKYGQILSNYYDDPSLI